MTDSILTPIAFTGAIFGEQEALGKKRSFRLFLPPMNEPEKTAKAMRRTPWPVLGPE